MSEKIKLSIPPVVAVHVRPGTPLETRLAGCEAADGMEPFERLTLLFCLSKDAEPVVRSCALDRLRQLPEDVVRSYADSEKFHPLVLESVISMRAALPPACLSEAAEESDLPDDLLNPEDDDPAEDAPVDEEGEQFISKFKISQMMGIGEKIKMALTGDKEWRSILVKDSNKLVSGSVVKNPRMTEAEVQQLIKSGIQNDEIMRIICSNKEWIKSYKIRKCLIENNRTPVQNSMRYLATMSEKDLAGFAKSKNISSVVSTMAKRLLLSKKK